MVAVGVDMRASLAGLALRSPLTCASGSFGSGEVHAELWREQGLVGGAGAQVAPGGADGGGPFACLGAVTTKGVSLLPWPGNNGLRIAETASGMLNSIGLENPGVEAFIAGDLAWLAKQDVPVIVNVSGHSIDQYAAVVKRLEAEPSVSAYELNISCPNVDEGGMAFGIDPAAAAAVTAVCREATDRPLIVKLTPNVTDITEVARAVEAAGADALSLVNTLAGMAIDADARRPVFERVVAGLSGPAIKPVALWAVYRVAQAVDLPLIGMGGICSAADAVEFMLAGATMVAVGSHGFTDPLAMPTIYAGPMARCENKGVPAVRDLVGALTIG
jgi:dihydroorotate dehydrogenase (NAD+) catalytic subunit